jgi:hypothetical protein
MPKHTPMYKNTRGADPIIISEPSTPVNVLEREITELRQQLDLRDQQIANYEDVQAKDSKVMVQQTDQKNELIDMLTEEHAYHSLRCAELKRHLGNYGVTVD